VSSLQLWGALDAERGAPEEQRAGGKIEQL